MPSYYDLPVQGTDTEARPWTTEDVNKYNKLPFWLAMNEVRRYPYWKTWDTLFGSIKWKANMGALIRGIRPEPSPVIKGFAFPANMTDEPNKNVIETKEFAIEARLKIHRFESKQFSFVPSFQDFRDNQVKYAHDDIIHQIAVFNEQFIRTWAFAKAKNLMVVNAAVAGGPDNQFQILADAQATDPTNAAVDTNATGSYSTTGFYQRALATGKTDAWLAARMAEVGTAFNGFLTLKALLDACAYLDNDLDAPTFEGVQNTPRDNDLVKGKYVLITSKEAWRNFVLDPTTNDLKALNLDLLFDGFRGSLFGMLTCKAERYPLRASNLTISNVAVGVFPDPQIEVAAALDSDSGVSNDYTGSKTRPNPKYTKIAVDGTGSAFEFAFLMGADAWKTLTVGPPPSQFTSKKMDAEKFYSLNWNGEIRLTDQVILKYSDGTYDLNKYGTKLQLISQLALGCIPGEINNYLTILHRRHKPSAAYA